MVSKFELIWGNILLLEGHTFHTINKLPFTYTFIGKSVRITRKTGQIDESINKGDFEVAYEVLKVYPDKGPGKLGELATSLGFSQPRGSSYVWGILHDKRVLGGFKTKQTGRTFGEIAGVKPGAFFASREAIAKAGIHKPTQAGISGSTKEGADSIVVSGGYEDDEASEDVIIYTGEGGRDPNSKKQTQDQKLIGRNIVDSQGK